MASRAPKRKKAAKRGGSQRPAPVSSVLGNDPFQRGAAVRAPAVLMPVPSPDPDAGQAAPVASIDTPAPAEPASAATASPVASEPSAPVAPAPSPAFVSAGAEHAPSPAAPASAALAGARARLADLETRVESAAAAAAARLGELARKERSGEQARDLVRAVAGLLPAVRERLSALAGVGSLFLSSGDVDAYGLDRELERRLSSFLDFLYASWWRVDARDVANVPASGPAIVVANHGGVVPWDALVLRTALRRDHPARRELRPLLDEHALRRRVLGGIVRRLGAVLATPENASGLLEAGEVVAAFPEGSRGSTRPWPDRYRIQRFGRGGFAKLAVKHGAAIVPCAIVGSEETALPMARTGWLSSALGMPFLSSPPPLPFVPLGAFPLPARWSLRFGVPIHPDGAGPDAAADQARVLDLTERTRASLQRMLDEDVASRRSVYL